MIESLLRKDLIPDVLIRFGVRKMTKNRIKSVENMGVTVPDLFTNIVSISGNKYMQI